MVSAIIVFLNEKKFIEEAIESVFAQTYDNWELLLVDDGSTDASTAIARRYAAQNPTQVRYLEHDGHQNRGLSASRNLGIDNAKGEYIGFLDADDVWLPHKLEQQVAILGLQPKAAMVYGASQYWHSWAGSPNDSQRDFGPRLGVKANTLLWPPRLLTLFLQGKAAVPCPSSILVRRSALNSTGGFEDSFRGIYEDQVFYAKICLRKPVFVSSQCWDRYRLHLDSVCSVVEQEGRTHAARLDYLHWLRGHMLEGGFKGTEVWKALQKELRHYEDLRRISWRKLARYLLRRSRKLGWRIVGDAPVREASFQKNHKRLRKGQARTSL